MCVCVSASYEFNSHLELPRQITDALLNWMNYQINHVSATRLMQVLVPNAVPPPNKPPQTSAVNPSTLNPDPKSHANLSPELVPGRKSVAFTA